jgi:hypothetical protein
MVRREDLARANADLDRLCAGDRDRNRLIEAVVRRCDDVVVAAWDNNHNIEWLIIKGEDKMDELFRLAQLDFELDHPGEEWDENDGAIEGMRLLVPVESREHALWLRKKYGDNQEEQVS